MSNPSNTNADITVIRALTDNMSSPELGHNYTLGSFPQTSFSFTIPPPLQSTPVQGHGQPSSFITDFDIQRIVQTLRMSLRNEIQSMVSATVAEHVAPLQNELVEMKNTIAKLNSKLAELETEVDNNNQYSRRHCVLISNIDEKQDESTDEIILNIAKDSGCSININDIDRSHRNGPKNSTNGKPRDIICKFTNYKAKSNFMKSRKQLRLNKSKIFINEQLTPIRRQIAYQCRQLKKDPQSPVSDTWSFDGTLYIRVSNQKESIRINCLQDLCKFGYKPQ